MDPNAQLVEALKRLVARTPGGVAAVADKAGASEENLKQILVGTRLPSGRPRGVGPNLRNRLSEAFPGWWDALDVPVGVSTVTEALSALARALAGHDDLTRQAVQPLVDRVVAHPEEVDRIAPRVEALLAAEPRPAYGADAAAAAAAEKVRESQMLEAAAKRARAMAEEREQPLKPGPKPPDHQPRPKRH